MMRSDPHKIVVYVYFQLLDVRMPVVWNSATSELLQEMEEVDGAVFLAGTRKNGSYKADRERFDHSRLRHHEVK